MIRNLFGAATQSGHLKALLDESALRHREAAHRVANASTPGGGAFVNTLEGQLAAQQEVDIEREMVEIADAQINFEAATRLLQQTHSQLRAAIGHPGRG